MACRSVSSLPPARRPTRRPRQTVQPLRLRGDVVADRGYFGRAVTEAIEASGATAHIPSQNNVRVVRSVDRELYRNRNLIERFFNRLKHFRGIATRYFKTAANFLAAIHLAAARLWIRIMSPRPRRSRCVGMASSA